VDSFIIFKITLNIFLLDLSLDQKNAQYLKRNKNIMTSLITMAKMSVIQSTPLPNHHIIWLWEWIDHVNKGRKVSFI